MHSTHLLPRLHTWRRCRLFVLVPAFLIAMLTPSLAARPSATARSQPTHSTHLAGPIRATTTPGGQFDAHTAVTPATLRFWDGPLQASATTRLNDSQQVRPGPDEQIRLIVQLRGEPLAAYARRTIRVPGRPTLAEAQDLRTHAAALAKQRRAVLSQLHQQGVTAQVSAEFSSLLHGLALTARMGDWPRITQISDVQAVAPDYVSHVTLSESVPLIGAPAVWALPGPGGQAVTGQEVRVAVIDTGIDYTHPALGGAIGPSAKVIGGYDFVNADADPLDDNGHGTHVAGIIAANGALKGVAPNAQLLAFKACDASGDCWDSRVIAAIERAVDPDGNPATDDAADVINLSLGRTGAPDDPLCQAVDQAVAQGIVVVASAGNASATGTVLAPGVARQALTVAAADKSDQLAAFSSRGPVPDFFDVIKPDLTAPGVAIRSTVPTIGEHSSPDLYTSLSGTSMAAPHVAGAAALLRQLHPSWTPALIKANLMNTATDLGSIVYDQGTGRVQVDAAARTPLIATPASLAFGLPLLDGTTTAQLTVTNLSAATVTATATISTVYVLDGQLQPIVPAAPVPYARLGATALTLVPGAALPMGVQLTIPPDAAEGHYTGVVRIRTATSTLTVPFAFTLLSKITVQIQNEQGVGLPVDEGWASVLVRIPDVDVGRSQITSGPQTFYVPAGTYNLHGFARTLLYQPGQNPLLLATTTTLPRNAAREVVLSGATARRFTIDTKTVRGDPFFVRQWDVTLLYHHDEHAYLTGASAAMGDPTSLQLPNPVPTAVDVWISDTPADVGFALGIMGNAFSPRYQRFRDLNADHWFDSQYIAAPGMRVATWADELYLYGWRYPHIDATTPNTLAPPPDQVSQYQITYDVAGPIDEPAFNVGEQFASSAESLRNLGTGIIPGQSFWQMVPAGITRTAYVYGVASANFLANDTTSNWLTLHEFYHPDWAKARPMDSDPNRLWVDDWDLLPLPAEQHSLRLGAGPLYPGLSFANDATTIRLIFPLLGSGQGNAVAWDRPNPDPTLTIERDGTLVSTSKPWGWALNRVMQQFPNSAPGAYRLVLHADHDGTIASTNTIEAAFRLPATDMNPPRVLGLAIPQRFTPGETLTATLTITDAESGMQDVAMRASRDRGTTWSPLTVVRSGDDYTAHIAAGSALSLTLAFTATDKTGNTIAFTSTNAAIRATPVTLQVAAAPTTVPLIATPTTIHLAGTLRGQDGAPLSRSALPIAISLNGQFVGYVRDLLIRPDATLAPGVIDFDWTFIPTDYISQAGPAQLRFVFDLGTYTRQEQLVTLQFVRPPPDLTLTVAADEALIVGQLGHYMVRVDNTAGAGTSSGPITVTDTLPRGLHFVAGVGTGWSCGADGQQVMCTHPGPVVGGGQLPDLTITVKVMPEAIGPLTSVVNVSTPDESNRANNQASSTVAVEHRVYLPMSAHRLSP